MTRNKVVFIGVALMVQICINLGAVELWNGFTTEMSQEQVVARSREVLEMTQNPTTASDSNTHFRIFPVAPIRVIQGDSNDRIINNSNFTFWPPNTPSSATLRDVGFQTLEIYSPIPAYRSATGMGGRYLPNIAFYFLQNKLYGISVNWASGFSDMLRLTTERYGNFSAIVGPRQNIGYDNQGHEYHMWKLDNILIYFASGRRMFFIDRNYVELTIAESERQRAENAAAEEARRRAVNEGVRF